MATTYTETPDNYCEIEVSIITGIQEIKNVFFCAKSVLFYIIGNSSCRRNLELK